MQDNIPMPLNVKMVPIDSIRPYHLNAKKHPKDQIEKIANSIQAFGFNQSIVTDKDGVIIVGHGRYEGAKFLKLQSVPVLTIDVTIEQANAYRLADNKLNESDWDMDKVIKELTTLDLSKFNIDLTGFDRDLLLDDDERDNSTPEIPKTEPRSKKGDIYNIGNHILMCGDSTSKEDVDKLMGGVRAHMVFTDPPYNVDYKGGMNEVSQNTREGILNDKMTKSEFHAFLKAVSDSIVEHCDGGVYICMSSSEIDTLKHAFEMAGGHWQSFIIWVKNNFTLSRADYQNTYEMILYGWPEKIVNHYFTDARDIANVWEDLRDMKTEYDGENTTISFQGFKVKIPGKIEEGQVIRKKQRTNIWRYDKPNRSVEHPTMKPVALCEEAIKNSSRHGDVVLDLFGGSGSTLIACEKMNRKARVMELDPKYVDVIVQRWVNYTDGEVIKNGKVDPWESTRPM